MNTWRTVLYFAYGSNMSSVRLRARIDILSCHGKALLPGFDLSCDKHSEADGSGKFTISPRHLEQVPGVLFGISETALLRLDQLEGPGYRRQHVLVDSAHLGTVEVLCYIALDEVRDPQLLPYDWYLAFAVAGAVEHELPAAHIHRLQHWPCQPDPDEERSARNRELLSVT